MYVLAHQGNHGKESQQAVDDAGDGREKIDEEFQSIRDSSRRQFGEKNGGSNAKWDGHEQGNTGGDHRAIDERQSAEIIHDGIPNTSPQKMKPEFVTRQGGFLPQHNHQQDRNQHNRGCKNKRNHARDLVTVTQPVKKRARARDRARAMNGCSG